MASKLMATKWIGKVLAVGLLLAVFGLLDLACASAPGASSQPAPHQAEVTAAALLPETAAAPSSIPTTLPTALPAIPETRRLSLEWPPVVKAGDSDRVILSLVVDSQGYLTPTLTSEGHAIHGAVVYVPNLYDTHDIKAEARLDIAGVEVKPGNELQEQLFPGETVTFYWSVRPEKVGDYQGSLALHLRFVPHDGSAESRKLVATQPVDIRAVNFLGLGGLSARLVGGVGTLVGSVLGLDNVLSWLWGVFKRRRASRQNILKGG